jgi:hypothetical protein
MESHHIMHWCSKFMEEGGVKGAIAGAIGIPVAIASVVTAPLSVPVIIGLAAVGGICGAMQKG